MNARSLNAVKAESDFQFSLVPCETEASLIMAATDGYSNSFPSDASFMQVGGDLFNMIQSEGIDTVQANFPSWLEETSGHGSGDDATLGLLWGLKPT